MNAAALARELGIREHEIDELVQRGLPFKVRGRSRSFELAAARGWLEANPHTDAKVAKTIEEVAAFLGLSSRFVYTLRTKGLPGKPGHYPLDEIAAWIAKQDAKGPKKSQDLLMEIRAQRELLDLEREQGQVVKVDLPQRVMARWMAEATVELDQTVDRIAAALPRRLTAKEREACRSAAAAQIDEARESLARGLEEMAKALERKSDDQAEEET
jgi:hypothetical protein